MYGCLRDRAYLADESPLARRSFPPDDVQAIKINSGSLQHEGVGADFPLRTQG